MSTTQIVKQYGEFAVTTARPAVLAAIGAGDLAVERARTVFGQFRSQATSSVVALPGEAQVQADLAVKEARTRAAEAAGTARTTAQQVAGAVRPETLFSTVTGLVGTARTQASTTVDTLAERGAEVLEDLRRQPSVRRIGRRTEQVVDTVEGSLEDAIDEAAEAVSEASDEVTSVAQKTAAKAGKAAAKAEETVHETAESTKSAVAETTEPAAEAPKPKAPAKKSSAAASKVPATTARVTRARTARRSDPTAVPAKKN